MPIYAAGPVLDLLRAELDAAASDESAATKQLLDLMKQSSTPTLELKQATKAMEDAHNRKMDVLHRMETHRLDKG